MAQAPKGYSELLSTLAVESAKVGHWLSKQEVKESSNLRWSDVLKAGGLRHMWRASQQYAEHPHLPLKGRAVSHWHEYMAAQLLEGRGHSILWPQAHPALRHAC